MGLDPNAVYAAVLTSGSAADLVGIFNYTVIGGGRIAPDPAWVAANISTEVMPIIGSMTCHREIFPQLRAALEEVISRGLAGELHPDEYAGCYYPRFIAGTTTLSNHSFGLAMDFNVPGNQRGTVGEMDRAVVSIFKKWGFAWGGDWNYTDPMHFELSAVVNPADRRGCPRRTRRRPAHRTCSRTCAPYRSSRPPAPTGCGSSTSTSPLPGPTRSWSRCTAWASRSPTSC